MIKNIKEHKLFLNRDNQVVKNKIYTCNLITGLYRHIDSNCRMYFYNADNKTWYYQKAYDNYTWHYVEDFAMLLGCVYQPTMASDIIFTIESIENDIKRQELN